MIPDTQICLQTDCVFRLIFSMRPPLSLIGLLAFAAALTSRRNLFSFCLLWSHLIQDLFPLLVVFALGDEAFVIHALELFELRFRAFG